MGRNLPLRMQQLSSTEEQQHETSSPVQPRSQGRVRFASPSLVQESQKELERTEALERTLNSLREEDKPSDPSNARQALDRSLSKVIQRRNSSNNSLETSPNPLHLTSSPSSSGLFPHFPFSPIPQSSSANKTNMAGFDEEKKTLKNLGRKAEAKLKANPLQTLVGMRSVPHFEKAVEDLAQMMEDMHFSLAIITEDYSQRLTDTNEDKLEDFLSGIKTRVNKFRVDVAQKITTITTASTINITRVAYICIFCPESLSSVFWVLY